tara:strand:+ start:2085 stop:2588 length:504 start_codon:yes stop_codon:yes gene_type:complete
MIWQKIQEELEGAYARGYALAKHLGCTYWMDRHIIKGEVYYHWDNSIDDYGNDDGDFGEYRVLTNEEADELAYDSIMDSLWAFSSSFLAGETEVNEDVFLALHNNGKCERNNDAVASLIKSSCGLQEFVDSAISADGRAHFIDSYDGYEHEVKVGRKTFYIYRVELR